MADKKQSNDLPEPFAVKAKSDIKKNEIPKTSGENADLKELVKKSIEWSEIIYNQNKKIKRRLNVMVVGDYLRLAFIIVPIILAIIYLPPLLSGILSQYGELFGGTGTVPNIGDLLNNSLNFNFSDIISNMSSKEIGDLQNALKSMPK